MPIRWSTSPKASPLLRAFLSSINKTPQHPLRTPPTAFPKSPKTSSRSFQSIPPPNNQSIFHKLSSLASVGKSIAYAGTGTFMSTLFALYLATKVESLAHETLYEYCPHKYYYIAEEDLPVRVKDKEMIRRRTGEVRSERVQGRIWDDSYLTLDGFVIPDEKDGTVVGAAELYAEEELEAENSKMTLWQRRMTENREKIIEQEEREFTKSESWLGMKPLWGDAANVSAKTANNSQLMERRRLQEEMAKKFQEKLMSTAMTA